MSIEPQLHLHFNVESDCRGCCPAFTGCFNKKKDLEEGEFSINKKMHLVSVRKKLSQKKRRNAQVAVAIHTHELLKHQCDNWECIKAKIKEVSGIDMEEEVTQGHPVTYEKLLLLSAAITQISQNHLDAQPQ